MYVTLLVGFFNNYKKVLNYRCVFDLITLVNHISEVVLATCYKDLRFVTMALKLDFFLQMCSPNANDWSVHNKYYNDLLPYI